MVVFDPVDAEAFFAEARRLIQTPDHIPIERGVFVGWKKQDDGSFIKITKEVADDGHRVIQHPCSVGLPAWIMSKWWAERPHDPAAALLADKWNYEGYDAEDPFSTPLLEGVLERSLNTPYCMELSFDTAYSYRGANGAGCAHLHAWLVRELGQWLDDHHKRWAFLDEYTGKWNIGGTENPGVERNLGDPELGAGCLGIDHVII